ncbi:response regulator transcription factor [Dactylosporangium sp. CA-139066]|uniref:response regulator transcription factor n=1 Tax=Dactylosporangium sp. CA-139066 TaxID=3239930 RepID=UPI003D94B7E4
MTALLTAAEVRAAIASRVDEIGKLHDQLARVDAATPRLTPRVLRAAYMAAAGLTAPQIARERHVSVNTVKTQLRQAYRALGVTRRAELRAALIRRQTNS